MSESEIQEYLEKALLDSDQFVLDETLIKLLQMMFNKNPSKRLSLEILYEIFFSNGEPGWIQNTLRLGYYFPDAYFDMFMPILSENPKKKEK